MKKRKLLWVLFNNKMVVGVFRKKKHAKQSLKKSFDSVKMVPNGAQPKQFYVTVKIRGWERNFKLCRQHIICGVIDL